ncbi:MAG: ABC transporter permease [Woeseiaceae bacterium]|nr:ABC transporter permease [Woeseiaceae bacterium]
MNITLRLAWRNLWRQPRRTWLTTGAMVFSNALLVFMMSLQFGMYDLMIDNTLKAVSGHMQVQAPGYVDDQKMRQAVSGIVPLADRLRAEIPEASIAARSQAFVLASSEERSYGIALYGVEPTFEPDVSSLAGLVKDGRFFEDTYAPEIVIGSTLARNLRVAVGDELTILGSGRDGSFAAGVVEIAGIFDSGVPDLDRTIAEIPIGLFDDVFYMNGAGHQIVINAPVIDEAPAILERARSLVSDDVVVHDWDRLQPGLRQAIQADISSAFFMYGVLVILVAFSVLNTQLMSVLERTHEFGIVMALGLKPGRLGRLVLLETALMGLMGGIIGAIVGAIVTGYFTVNGLYIPGMDEMAVKFNLPPRMYPQISLLSLSAGPAIVLAFSILAALYPAVRLNWMRPVDAMRAV